MNYSKGKQGKYHDRVRPPQIRGFPSEPKEFDPLESPTKRVVNWVSGVPDEQSPPPHESLIAIEDLQREKKEYNMSYRPGTHTGESSFKTNSTLNSPFEEKLDELASLFAEMNKMELSEQEKKAKIEEIQKSWVINGMPLPENWPRLRIPENYDDDQNVAAFIASFHREPKMDEDPEVIEEPKVNEEPKSNEEPKNSEEPMENQEPKEKEEEVEKVQTVEGKDLWTEIDEYGSDGNKFEASELVEYKNHEWCIALRIDRQKTMDKNIMQHLVYSYQCGIQRLMLTTTQMDSLGTTLLMKYKLRDDGTDVLPIHSSIPSTYLLSPKYRHNKGIELRVYGIVNFIDFIKDPEHPNHRTMVWTDAVGPVYLTAADRSNIRRKLMLEEAKIFAPLRMCQMVVKSEFTSTVPNGTVLKWAVTTFTALIEEQQKGPDIGRNLWPARVLRFDDLVVTKRPSGGTWLQSHKSREDSKRDDRPEEKEETVEVFAGPHLNGIINSAGLDYAKCGVMSAFVVPCFHNNEFIHYEALIVGPPRVVMMLTEGRFLNYYPKTWPPSIQKMRERHRQTTMNKPQVREPPIVMKPPGYQLKSLRGYNEFHFDFNS